jgi:hypothetical protein
MSTETTRVSSYVRAEGFKDSAGTMYQYASAVNNLVSGLTTAVNASSLVNLVSGLTTAVNASSLVNLVSGLTTSVDASALKANISGLTAGAAMLNAALYGTKYKVAFGSALATDAVVMTSVTNCGLSTALYAFVTPQVTGLIAGAIATQTGIRWLINNSTGVATQGIVSYIVIGNE